MKTQQLIATPSVNLPVIKLPKKAKNINNDFILPRVNILKSSITTNVQPSQRRSRQKSGIDDSKPLRHNSVSTLLHLGSGGAESTRNLQTLDAVKKAPGDGGLCIRTLDTARGSLPLIKDNSITPLLSNMSSHLNIRDPKYELSFAEEDNS